MAAASEHEDGAGGRFWSLQSYPGLEKIHSDPDVVSEWVVPRHATCYYPPTTYHLPTSTPQRRRLPAPQTPAANFFTYQTHPIPLLSAKFVIDNFIEPAYSASSS